MGSGFTTSQNRKLRQRKILWIEVKLRF